MLSREITFRNALKKSLVAHIIFAVLTSKNEVYNGVLEAGSVTGKWLDHALLGENKDGQSFSKSIVDSLKKTMNFITRKFSNYRAQVENLTCGVNSKNWSSRNQLRKHRKQRFWLAEESAKLHLCSALIFGFLMTDLDYFMVELFCQVLPAIQDTYINLNFIILPESEKC
nr:uncharacterized protein LOC109184802 isoform X1 [Ipomoea batatas]